MTEQELRRITRPNRIVKAAIDVARAQECDVVGLSADDLADAEERLAGADLGELIGACNTLARRLGGLSRIQDDATMDTARSRLATLGVVAVAAISGHRDNPAIARTILDTRRRLGLDYAPSLN